MFIIFFHFLLNFKEGLRLPCLPYSVSDLLYSVRQEFGHSISIVNENNDHNSERITKDVKGITEFRDVTVWVIEISSIHTHTHTHTHTSAFAINLGVLLAVSAAAAAAAHYLLSGYTIIEKFSNLRHLVCAVNSTSGNYV